MTDPKIIYQVDAFSDVPFKGNPAGVMIVGQDFDPALMQQIAMEMNLSETAFVIPEEAYFRIRYFTPTDEVPLCGHATLASSHVLYETGIVQQTDEIHFRAEAGDLHINKDQDTISMNFPAYPVEQVEIPEKFRELIGFQPVDCYRSNENMILAIAPSEQDIADASPNFELMNDNNLGHVVITAESNLPDTDFVVRCFCPDVGINEDPVTGSVHCALVPVWKIRTGKSAFNSFQISKRTGRLKLNMNDDRIRISGSAVTVFKAVLSI